MEAERISDAEELAEVAAFLAKRPEANLSMLAALEEGRGRFLGAREESGALAGVALVEDEVLVYLHTQSPRAARALGKALRPLRIEVLLAERETAERTWRAMSWTAPRLILDQHLYSLEIPPAPAPLALRPARRGELFEVQRIAQAMFWEEVGMPPSVPALNEHIEEELAEGSLRVHAEGSRLLFMARVAVRCKAGAELQRVYTAPSRRREGIASRGIATLCRELLRELPRVVLRVNESNRAALGLYAKLGFERAGSLRLFCR